MDPTAGFVHSTILALALASVATTIAALVLARRGTTPAMIRIENVWLVVPAAMLLGLAWATWVAAVPHG